MHLRPLCLASAISPCPERADDSPRGTVIDRVADEEGDNLTDEDPCDRVAVISMIGWSLTLSSWWTGPTGMRFFSRQPTPPPQLRRIRCARRRRLRLPTSCSRIASSSSVRRNPAGLAAYTQRVREGLTLEELLRCLLDSPEREDRIRTGVVQQGAARVPAADASLIDPKQVMRRYGCFVQWPSQRLGSILRASIDRRKRLNSLDQRTSDLTAMDLSPDLSCS